MFGPARADVGPKNGDTWVPAPSGPVAVDKDPLTVADVLIDKTAANSVVARAQAIEEAPAVAFQKLAERNLPPKQAKAVKVPKNVAALVQDFEIKGEQMSSTRYVAKFTVRFSDAVRQYIDVRETPPSAETAEAAPGKPPAEAMTAGNAGPDEVVDEEPARQAGDDYGSGKVIWNDGGGKPYAPAEAAETLGKMALILPYLENMSGQTVLWEDPNPWRRIWQNALPSAMLGGTQLVVPLGDVSDLAAGPSSAVWSGDYGPVEKLRRNYNADEVILLAANKSGSSMTVDIYTYHSGRFRHRGSITPFVGDKSDVEAFRQALAETLRYLAQGQLQGQPPQARHGGRPSLEAITRDVTHSVETHTTVIDGNTPPPRQPDGLVLKPYNAPNAPQPFQPQPPRPQPVMTYTPPGAVYVPPGTTLYAPQAPAAGGRAQLAAMATFRNFQAWVELQKRLNTMTPMVGVDIRSINNNSAAITLNYASSLDALRGELATRGIALGSPSGMDPVQGPVYSLQLVN